MTGADGGRRVEYEGREASGHPESWRKNSEIFSKSQVKSADNFKAGTMSFDLHFEMIP